MPKKYYARKGDSYRDRDGETDMSKMIREDHSAVANLPQEVHYKPWPMQPVDNKYYLDDTISGIDETARDNMRKVNEYMSESMY